MPPEDFAADAHRLAMELECLLLSTKDTAALSKWWDSAYEALDQHRQLVKEAYGEPSEKTSGSLFTHPPRREWRGLTDEEMVAIAHRKCWEYRHSSDPHHSHTYKFNHSTLTDFRYAIEAALKERNV
jgi:hypothetical protein